MRKVWIYKRKHVKGWYENRLRKRLMNLEFRIEHAPRVTSQRLDKLARKLGERVDREMVRSRIRESHALIMRVLQAHFDTCLSPHDMNFFSTIANTMDINKQVLYSKTQSGRIIGRCLFALADSGAILVYRPYCHNPNLRLTSSGAHILSQRLSIRTR